MRRAKSQANKKRLWVYNPYTSEPIQHFEGLSRSDIEKLMVKMKKGDELMKQQAGMSIV
jgi:hypothetical protein